MHAFSCLEDPTTKLAWRAMLRRTGRIGTALDAVKGYHQLDLASEYRSKTALACHQGLYQYKWMPFGLKNASAFFGAFWVPCSAGYAVSLPWCTSMTSSSSPGCSHVTEPAPVGLVVLPSPPPTCRVSHCLRFQTAHQEDPRAHDGGTRCDRRRTRRVFFTGQIELWHE